jgi:hypothetical protein
VERDLRLDFFRGLGLWMIFLDHIPHDVVSWLTLRNYGFSDAAEFFVFISGYLVGWIYAPVVRGGLFLAAVKRLWKRAAQMYVAHIMLFLIFTAQIARTARRFDNPMYENEFNVFNFLQHPDVLIGQAITLRYKPVNLDVLPLYITLVLAAPFIVWCLVASPKPDLAWFYRALHSVALHSCRGTLPMAVIMRLSSAFLPIASRSRKAPAAMTASMCSRKGSRSSARIGNLHRHLIIII